MIESNKAVFLSYASEDGGPAARICAALRTAGIEVWFDQSELRGGDAWDRKIKTQIHECALFIAVISAHSNARAEGYFRREWRLAVERTHDMSDRVPFLVPVVIDHTNDKAADVPESFANVQWTRLPSGETPPTFCERIRVLLGGAETPAQPQLGRRATLSVGARPAAYRWRVLTVAGALLVVVGGWQAWRLIHPKTQTGAMLPAAVALPEKSVAVLPFVDMSEKKDQEYFADGMAEEILNILAKVPDLKVIGRTSSFQFKGKTDDLRKVGMTLGAAYVVEGSVRRSGDHIRVTAQLIDTRNDAHRWSETYDRDAGDALEVQGEIASALVRELQLEIAPSLMARSRVPSGGGEVYETYLRGLHASNRYDQQGLEEAVAAFRRVLSLDPTFVPAAEALALSLDLLAGFSFVNNTGWEAARAAAAAVLKLDPQSALGHAVLGDVYTQHDWDWAAGASEFKTALEHAPNDPTILASAAQARLAVGQAEEALRYLDTANSVDPLDPNVQEIRCWAYESLARFAEAEAACRRVLAVSPTFGFVRRWLVAALVRQGKHDSALAEIRLEMDPGEKILLSALVDRVPHRNKDLDAALARLEAEGYLMGLYQVYAFRGQADESLRFLEKAYAQKYSNLFLVKGDPLLKNLAENPQYRALLRRMKLPET